MEDTKVVKDTNSANTGQKKMTKMGILQQSFSIDETKLSALIMCLFGCMLFGGYNYIMLGDITANLTSIITALIYSIAGVNMTNAVLNRFDNKSNNTQQQQRPSSPTAPKQ